MIIATQIIGIITLGYIINEIGHHLAQLRIEKESFERNLVHAQQIGNYYSLPNEINDRIRNELVQKEKTDELFDVREEQNLLLKLSENLRNEVKYQNSINLIKSCLFFICNWTKSVQNQSAKKLSTLTAIPGEKLSNTGRIYIISQGSFNLYTERRGKNKIHFKKDLVVLRKDSEKEVHRNTYGYTSFFTESLSKLFATAKQFSICYVLEYSDLMEIINDSSVDIEHFHQIKAQLQLTKFPEKMQYPDLINNRQNFNPLPFFIIKKYLKTSKKQKRKNYLRYRMRSKCNFDNSGEQKIKSQKQFGQDKMQYSLQQTFELLQQYEAIMKTNKNLKNSNEAIQNDFKQKNQTIKRMITSQHDIRKTFKTLGIEEHLLSDNNIKDIYKYNLVETSDFEIGKEYQNFYSKKNKSRIIGKLRQTYNRNMGIYISDRSDRQEALETTSLSKDIDLKTLLMSHIRKRLSKV